MESVIKEELDHQGILEKIDTAEGSAPVVPVIKSTGAICLCGDYKVSVNPLTGTLYLTQMKYLQH